MVHVVHTSNVIASKDTYSYKNAFQTKEKYERSGKAYYDTYEEDSEEQDCCETYHDWSKINIKGYVSAKDRLYNALYDDIHSFMENYHRGNYSKDEVKAYMKKCCEMKIDYAIWSTPEKQISEKEKENIILQTFALFTERNAQAAVQVCLGEGKKICESKGYYDSDYTSFAYYDADKYYSWKEMKNSLNQFVDEIGKELLGVEKEYHLYKDPTYFDVGFQKAWNGSFVGQMGFEHAVNETEEPPRGFKFFYRFYEEGYVEFQEKNQVNEAKEKNFQRKFQWNNLLNMLGAEHFDFLKHFFRKVDPRTYVVKSPVSNL